MKLKSENNGATLSDGSAGEGNNFNGSEPAGTSPGSDSALNNI